MGAVIVWAFASLGTLVALVLVTACMVTAVRALHLWMRGQTDQPEFRHLSLMAMRIGLAAMAVFTVTLLPSYALGFHWSRSVLVSYFELLAVAGVVTIIYWRATRSAKQ